MNRANAIWIASIIVTTVWNIWRARCSLIFRGQPLNPFWISRSLVDQVDEHHRRINQPREYFFLNILNCYPQSFFIFIDASWLVDSHFGGCDFYIIDFHNRLILASCSNIVETSALNAELATTALGLRIADERKIKLVVLFTECFDLKQVLNQSFNVDTQRLNPRSLQPQQAP